MYRYIYIYIYVYIYNYKCYTVYRYISTRASLATTSGSPTSLVPWRMTSKFSQRLVSLHRWALSQNGSGALKKILRRGKLQDLLLFLADSWLQNWWSNIRDCTSWLIGVIITHNRKIYQPRSTMGWDRGRFHSCTWWCCNVWDHEHGVPMAMVMVCGQGKMMLNNGILCSMYDKLRRYTRVIKHGNVIQIPCTVKESLNGTIIN